MHFRIAGIKPYKAAAKNLRADELFQRLNRKTVEGIVL